MEAEIDDVCESEKIHRNDPKKGPHSELEYWRRRVQRLTNLAEQLKAPTCNSVVNVVSSYSQVSDMDEKRSIGVNTETLLKVLRRWKAIDLSITEHINEAMDNEKYLRTLQKFVVPLHTAQPHEVIDPATRSAIRTSSRTSIDPVRPDLFPPSFPDSEISPDFVAGCTALHCTAFALF